MHSCNNEEEGKKAETHYLLIKKNNKYSMLDIKLKTGRKNQIRVHMKDIGHPIVGDIKYGAKENPVDRLCLHAKSLAFFHPVTGKKISFVSEIPECFKKLIDLK
jgi:23S rRNA pseudouridine1911/1915/1917 synthase